MHHRQLLCPSFWLCTSCKVLAKFLPSSHAESVLSRKRHNGSEVACPRSSDRARGRDSIQSSSTREKRCSRSRNREVLSTPRRIPSPKNLFHRDVWRCRCTLKPRRRGLNERGRVHSKTGRLTRNALESLSCFPAYLPLFWFSELLKFLSLSFLFLFVLFGNDFQNFQFH